MRLGVASLICRPYISRNATFEFVPHLRHYSSEVPKESEPGKTQKSANPKVLTVSSCQANTILTGLNYLKDQTPVVALPDDEYPPWLWDLLKPKVIPDDGPGGQGERMRRRQENRKQIKERNFMQTQ